MEVLILTTIFFYASGPNAYSSENNTNLNLYEDKISYFLSVGSDNGSRISDLVEPVGETSFMIDYYTNYQFPTRLMTITLQKLEEDGLVIDLTMKM